MLMPACSRTRVHFERFPLNRRPTKAVVLTVFLCGLAPYTVTERSESLHTCTAVDVYDVERSRMLHIPEGLRKKERESKVSEILSFGLPFSSSDFSNTF